MLRHLEREQESCIWWQGDVKGWVFLYSAGRIRRHFSDKIGEDIGVVILSSARLRIFDPSPNAYA